MSPTSSTVIPSLPPMFFLSTTSANRPTSCVALEEKEQSSLNVLPAEMVHHCLSTYSDWGELAKLANVKCCWSSLLRAAADFGGHDSKWSLALALLDGTNGLASNPRLAIEYLTELAEGYAPAARKLATCYLNGNGVEQNNEVGINWLRAAYTNGDDLDAAYELGTIYEYGHHDVAIDVVLAAEWFLKAAKGGHVEGMVEYALACELGCGREQSDEEALEWYEKAAAEGHITAKYSVGEAFEEARGVPQSDSEACLWYFKAASDGCEDGKKALKRLRDIARIVLPGWEGQLNVQSAGNAL